MARVRAASIVYVFWTLLAIWGSLAGAQSTDSTSIASSTTSTSTSSTSESRTASTFSSAPSNASVRTFTATFSAFPTDTITTKLPQATGPPSAFIPLLDTELVNERLSFVFNVSDPDASRAVCWYPISGSYGLLSRVLFYSTLIAALVLRHHQWLYAGALVTSLTYSGSAAIHACLLVWHGHKDGDLDVIPLLTILGFSCTMTVPLLNWSDTLRNIGRNANEVRRGIAHGPERCRTDRNGEPREQEFKRAARTILLYWSLLILVGFLATFVTIESTALLQKDTSWHINTSSGVDQLICTPPNGTMDYSVGQSESLLYALISQEFVDVNNCLDPCSRSIDGTVPLFRTPGSMISPTIHQLERVFAGVTVNSAERTNDQFLVLYLQFGLFILPYVIIQGAYAVLFGRRTPGQARNLIYALLTRIRLTKARTPLDPAGPVQKWFAKYIALMSYGWAVFVFVLSVPAVIVIIVAGEIFMFLLPENEHAFEASQWMPFTSVGLALLAGFLARYNDDLLYMVTLTCYKLAWLVIHPTWLFLRCFRPRRGGTGPSAKNIITGDLEEMPDPQLYRRAAGIVLFGSSSTLGAFLKKRITDIKNGFVGEVRQLFGFWKDPEQSRANQGGVPHATIEPCQCAWGCSCSSIQVQGKCRHEERICLQGRRDNEPCDHIPQCQHTRQCAKARRRNVRLRALHPERRTIAMALGPIHADMIQVDLTKTPIPFRGSTIPQKSTLPPVATSASQKYTPAPEGSESEMDEKLETAGNVVHMSHRMQRWQPGSRSQALRGSGSLKRMFKRKSIAGGDNDPSQPPLISKEPVRPSMLSRETARQSPGSKSSDESKDAVSTVVRDASVDTVQPTVQAHDKGGTIMVTEGAVHPTMRGSFISDDSNAVPYSFQRHPNREQGLSNAELSRQRSMLKNLPDIPSPGAPRPPNTTPNHDARSLVSAISVLSPMGISFSRTSMADRPDDVSPEATPLGGSGPQSSRRQSSSGQHSKITSPAPNVEEMSEQGQGYGKARDEAGLQTSFEQGIMGRQRRSQFYGTELPRSRDRLFVAEDVPMAISLKAEEDTSDDEGTFHEQPRTGQITPRPHRRLRDDSTETDGTEDDDIASVSAASEQQPPPRLRHIAELAQFLPGLRESTGTFLTAHEKHKLLDPPSGASTPPIQLPALSPPDPNSNAARIGSMLALDRSPHLSLGSLMYTPERMSGSSLLRTSVLTTSGTAAAEITSAPRSPQSTLDGIARFGASVSRQSSDSPRPSHSSTVDYLQVRRPSDMDYGDQITLRKDQFGQYQIVTEDNEQHVGPERVSESSPRNERDESQRLGQSQNQSQQDTEPQLPSTSRPNTSGAGTNT